MKCPAVHREIKLIIFTISHGGILIKNKHLLQMLLFLITSAHVWVTEKVGEQRFLPGLESCTNSKKQHVAEKAQAEDGARGAMTHRVSSYMSHRCSDLSTMIE